MTSVQTKRDYPYTVASQNSPLFEPRVKKRELSSLIS